MKPILKLEGLPLPIDRNRLALIERTSRYGGNGVKQEYQAQVRAVATPQIPSGWSPLTIPVFLVFEFRFGKIEISAGRNKTKMFDPSNCDANNVIDRKMMIDALTVDRRKSVAGKFDPKDPSHFFPNKKFRPDSFPRILLDDEGNEVKVVTVQPIKPRWTKKGTIKKQAYKLAVTVDPAQTKESKRLWYPTPSQDHAIFTDDSRRYIPLPSLPLQLEINSDNPGVDLTIYDLSEHYDFDKNRYNLGFVAERLLSTINELN